MESVAAHAGVVQRARNRETPRAIGPLRVERGVETGDLRQLRITLAQAADRGEVVGLVQRRERIERFEAIEHGTTPSGVHHRRLIDLVIPNATDYRRRFLEPGGWIDQAAFFDYPRDAAAFLRPEFTQLTTFIDYCIDTFPASPAGQSAVSVARAEVS